MRIFLFILSTILSIEIYSQDNYVEYELMNMAANSIDSVSDKTIIFERRFRTLRTIGRSFIGTGIAYSCVTGFIMAISNQYGGVQDCGPATRITLIPGGCLICAGIPFLIEAHRNKRKARRVSLGADCIATPVVVGGNRREVQPALTLRFNF